MNIIDFFLKCWWWIFLLMFLSFLLGWFSKRLFGGESGECCDELKRFKAKFNDLESKYNHLLSSADKIPSIHTVPESTKMGIAPQLMSLYEKLPADHLQIIEGIGPKMEEVLNAAGLKTWKELAGKTPAELRSILDKADASKYKIIDPSTWSDQAQLAVNGKWEELISMQKTLDTGKTNAINETDSKLEKMMVKLGLLKKWKRDDLKAVEGIGPKIEGLLIAAGIKTWDDLSDTPVNKLKEILSDAGDRYKLADPTTWPEQAELAAEGRWNDLQSLQDKLIGGR
jgi:predicted flap endonuclease-1-like 5' DNA nuclease